MVEYSRDIGMAKVHGLLDTECLQLQRFFKEQELILDKHF